VIRRAWRRLVSILRARRNMVEPPERNMKAHRPRAASRFGAAFEEILRRRALDRGSVLPDPHEPDAILCSETGRAPPDGDAIQNGADELPPLGGR
jgi:hypothetical protein